MSRKKNKAFVMPNMFVTRFCIHKKQLKKDKEREKERETDKQGGTICPLKIM